MAGHADSFEHGLHHSPHACRTNICTNAALGDTLGACNALSMSRRMTNSKVTTWLFASKCSCIYCRCYRHRYLVKCLLVAVCIHHVVLIIPWPGLTPVRVAVWCTLLTSCLLNLVGEGGASYLRHSCLCPMGTVTAL